MRRRVYGEVVQRKVMRQKLGEDSDKRAIDGIARILHLSIHMENMISIHRHIKPFWRDTVNVRGTQKILPSAVLF